MLGSATPVPTTALPPRAETAPRTYASIACCDNAALAPSSFWLVAANRLRAWATAASARRTLSWAWLYCSSRTLMRVFSASSCRWRRGAPAPLSATGGAPRARPAGGAARLGPLVVNGRRPGARPGHEQAGHEHGDDDARDGRSGHSSPE